MELRSILTRRTIKQMQKWVKVIGKPGEKLHDPKDVELDQQGE